MEEAKVILRKELYKDNCVTCIHNCRNQKKCKNCNMLDDNEKAEGGKSCYCYDYINKNLYLEYFGTTCPEYKAFAPLTQDTLDPTPTTKEYLDSLCKIYLKCYWANYGILEFPFSGFYKDLKGKAVPLVWNHQDYNGTHEEYILEPITFTTTGQQYGWTFNKEEAEEWEAKSKKDY